MIQNSNKLTFFIFLFSSLLCVTTYSNAQEGGLVLDNPVQERKDVIPSSEDGELELKESSSPSTNSSNSENSTRLSAPISEQNSSIKKTETPVVPLKENATPITKKQEVQEGEESVLTFNFLYYIIQKFKFAEVIDQE